MKKKETSDDFNKFNIFKSIVELTTKHGKMTVGFSLIIFLGIMIILTNRIDVNKLLDKYTDNQETIHQEGMLKRQYVNNVIIPMLDALRLKTKADRVMLFEFHNGGKNSAGLPFEHFSAMYEVIDLDNDSIDSIREQYKQQETGAYTDLIERLRRKSYIFSSDITLEKNSMLIRKMRRNEVKSCWIYGIFNTDGTPKAILSITSNHIDGLDEAKINRITPEVIHRISSLLTGINNNIN